MHLDSSISDDEPLSSLSTKNKQRKSKKRLSSGTQKKNGDARAKKRDL